MPAIAEPPSFETERLTLRPHRLKDYANSAAMWGDETFARHFGGKPATQEETWARLLRYAGHWTLMGFGYWVAREKHTQAFVGEVGFANARREITPPFGGAPELGWAIAQAFWRQGFATEAAKGALAWGTTAFPSARTVCLVGAGNLASLRVAEKCGYKVYAETSYRGEPCVLLER